MISIKVPFQIDSTGSLATVRTQAEIAFQQILDVLVTNFNERILRPAYGGDLQTLLMDVSTESVTGEVINRLRAQLVASVTMAEIVDIDISGVDMDATIFVDVQYRLLPNDMVLTLRASINGLISEETPL